MSGSGPTKGLHLVPVSRLLVGDVVHGYGHGVSERPQVASYYPFEEGPLVVRAVRRDGRGFTYATLGPANGASITTTLEDETCYGDLAAVDGPTLGAIRDRGPCRECGRCG